jgi:hypothetical protein
MATLPCPDGAGSINNPSSVGQVPDNTPYVPVAPCVGEWQISGETDACAHNETQLQTNYAAENININGAPLKVYKLLGVHEQGNGSLLSKGDLFASDPAPGYPLSGVNHSGSWRSIQTGSSVTAVAYVGIDFGINTLGSTTASEYKPVKPDLQKVGAVHIQQADLANNFARQLRVDIADGAVSLGTVVYLGINTGSLAATLGPDAEQGTVTVTFSTTTAFSVSYTRAFGTVALGTGTLPIFQHPVISFTISGSVDAGDVFRIPITYVWKRAAVFNVTQSGASLVLNLQRELLAKAVRVVPTLYSGSSNWEVLNFDVVDSAPTDHNNIQDLFYNENRDRDYAKTPLTLKAQYNIADSITDLSKFGINILDQYSFVCSFPVMVGLLGRPLVVGDIIEVVPELQYDQNLKPVRKFLEVTDVGWASVGFSTAWVPTLYRFSAQQAMPSQETRDIFGTMDTQKFLTPDDFFSNMSGQIDTNPLTTTEEIQKTAAKAVPETGSDDGVSIEGVPMRQAPAPVNPKGQPVATEPKFQNNIYIEDGLPPANEMYKEGYELPDVSSATDGDWFRLYYPETTNIAPRLYRYSAVKNRWIFMEQDRRAEYGSARPAIQKILQSTTKQGLGKKNV